MKHLKLLTIVSSSALIGTLVPITTSCSNKDHDIKIESIMVASNPTKTNYAKGEKFSSEGLVVKAIKTDYTHETLDSSKYTVSIADDTRLIEIGTKTVSIALKDSSLTTSFDIEVGAAKIASLAVTHDADKYVYNSGEELELNNFEVTATYTDDTQKVLSTSEYSTYPAVGQAVYETQYLYVYTPELEVTTKSYIIVTSATKDFASAGWDEIGMWISCFEKGLVTESQFCSHFLNGTTPISSLNGFLGLKNHVVVANLNYEVEIVGLKHDTYIDPETKETKTSLFTFRFTNIIQKSKTQVSLCGWDTDSCCDYMNSTIRANLNGTGKGKISWSEQSFTGNVYQNIQDNLKPFIKCANKEVGISTDKGKTFVATKYTDYLFLPTMTELGGKATQLDYITEGKVYEYYTSPATPSKICVTNLSGDDAAYWTCTAYLNNVGDSVHHVYSHGQFQSAYVIPLPGHCVAPYFCI